MQWEECKKVNTSYTCYGPSPLQKSLNMILSLFFLMKILNQWEGLFDEDTNDLVQCNERLLQSLLTHEQHLGQSIAMRHHFYRCQYSYATGYVIWFNILKSLQACNILNKFSLLFIFIFVKYSLIGWLSG